jgi:transcriptional regulator with XRE-family HTH domain
MNEEFVRNRITKLRVRKGVSEYKMSYDLGHSRGYIYNISSRNASPSLKELFAIMDYLNVTPLEFFDEENMQPELTKRVISGIKGLNEQDLIALLSVIDRFSEQKKAALIV